MLSRERENDVTSRVEKSNKIDVEADSKNYDENH
jgi:hypothetical protein